MHVKITKALGLQVKLKKTTIMTTTIQTSAFYSQLPHSRRRVSIFSVVINGEDGNYQEYEIEAANEQEAHRKADSIAQQSMIDITYVEVYRIA